MNLPRVKLNIWIDTYCYDSVFEYPRSLGRTQTSKVVWRKDTMLQMSMDWKNLRGKASNLAK